MNTDKLGLPLWWCLSGQRGVFDMVMAVHYIVKNPSMTQFYEGLEDAFYEGLNRPTMNYIMKVTRKG